MGSLNGRAAAPRLRFGLAVENFTPHTKRPDVGAILQYSRRAEEMGFDSLWVWDHILLGSKIPFPFLESLSTLAALAAVTDRVQLGTGILVLPLRNPVILAKETTSIDHLAGPGRLVLGMASGWYEREFEACGVPFHERGRVFEQNLDVLERFWREDRVTGDVGDLAFHNAVMLPKPATQPRPTVLIGGYVDKVLRRVATRSDGWLTYFYTAESFGRAWRKIQGFAEEAGRDPSALRNVAQLPICIDRTFEEADRKARAFIDEYFDVAPWSESSPESALRGTPDQCAEQLAEHFAAGVEHVCFVPWSYDHEQVERIHAELLPLVREGWARGPSPSAGEVA